ncbi:MAG: glutaredoxin [Prevotella sp.]|nr:glutaredoxin [Prevotella sp.]
MIKMYVMKTCPYCEYVERQGAGDSRFRLIDIGSHVMNLKEFLDLRDSHPAFAEARAEGDVGIPCYVLEDGTVTLSSADVGLEPMPDGPACSIDGKGC